MGQSSGSVGPAIGGSPFGGLRVLSPMDIARASPQYDPYTASRRPNYMPYGPNQQFYQPIYQPSYSQFSPMGYGQAPFGGFYMPQRMGFGQKFSQPQRSLDDLSNFDLTGQGVFRNNPMPRNMMPPEMFQPMLSPQPIQSQYRPIPYMTQTQLDARQRVADAAAAAAAPVYDYGGGGGFGDGFGGGNTGGDGSVGGSGASNGDSGGSVGAEGAGDSGAGPGDGPGGYVSGGKVRKPSYGGIDSLLRK